MLHNFVNRRLTRENIIRIFKSPCNVLYIIDKLTTNSIERQMASAIRTLRINGIYL